MSTQYQSSRDVPSAALAKRLDELAEVVSNRRDRISVEFTMRIPAECDRDADLVMAEAAVRLRRVDQLVESLEKIAQGEIEEDGFLVAMSGEECMQVAYAALSTHREQQGDKP